SRDIAELNDTSKQGGYLSGTIESGAEGDQRWPMKTGKSRSLSPCPTWHPWPRRAGIFSKQNQAPHGIWRERKSSRPSLRAHAITGLYGAGSRGARTPRMEQ